MKTNKLTIRASHLKALNRLASRDETRSAINGVHVEYGPQRQCTFVATDGRRIVAWQNDVIGEGEEPFTIPARLINAIPAEWMVEHITVERTDDALRLSIADGIAAISILGTVIPYAFPNWRTVFPQEQPKTCEFNHFGMNLEFFTEIAQTARDLIGEPRLQITGAGELHPIFLRARNFEAALMPVRFDSMTKLGVGE